MYRSEGIRRPLAELVHPFEELTEDGRMDRFPGGRTRAHGDVGSVPRLPEASDLEFGAVEIGVGEDHHGSDAFADVEHHRPVAGTRRLPGGLGNGVSIWWWRVRRSHRDQPVTALAVWAL